MLFLAYHETKIVMRRYFLAYHETMVTMTHHEALAGLLGEPRPISFFIRINHQSWDH